MTPIKPDTGSRALVRWSLQRAVLAAVLFGAPLMPGANASLAYADAERQTYYVDAKSVELVHLLSRPPANDSAETRAELDLMMKIQQTRDATESARAKADDQVSIYRFADALGDPAAFTAKNAPRTDALFRKILADEGVIVGAGKEGFARPRPFVLETHLAPVIAKPAPIGSYPSGHTTWAFTVALVLGDMIPERRAQLLERAAEYGHNRTVAGVHYPSDVEAGKLAGSVLAASLFGSPAFQADYAAAKTELRQALNLPTQLN